MPLLTVFHPAESHFPIFLIHKATLQHSANLIYKGVAGLTQHINSTIQLDPSTPKYTLQQILDEELTSPLHPTIIIAPLLSRILYIHPDTHRTIDRPLWHTDIPGPWHSPRYVHAHIGTITDPISSFVEENMTLVHATCNQDHSAETITNPTITACIEAFRMQPAPLRVMVISRPQVGYAITDRVINMPQAGITIIGIAI
jgi:hypothetical protein